MAGVRATYAWGVQGHTSEHLDHTSQELAMSTVPTRHSPATASTVTGRSAPDASQHWPHDLLQAFCLRMSSQGMCVSRALMLNDRRYGLEQLSHAHNMADDALRTMAVQLFCLFETRQSGISGPH